jgi:two-component system sensor histidine kinase RegB
MLTYLTHLRWHAVGGQAVAIGVAAFVMDIALPLPALGACVAVLAASNLALAQLARRQLQVSSAWIAGVLAFDVLLLTLELGLSGGATNPFTIFYLVPILVAGLLLPRPWLGCITLLAVASHACLFAWPVTAELGLTEPRGFAGPWLAFLFLAFFTALITARTARALRARHEELLRKQRIASHAEKLASLSTLAAGAAHELGSPLGTIAVTAEELDALIVEAPEEAIGDARIIREEAARCREIVHRMNARAGQLLGELPEPTTTAAILSDLQVQASPRERDRLVVLGGPDEAIECPTRGLVRSLGNLVSNALQASEATGAQVLVSVRRVADRVQFVVEDRGSGITPEVRSRLGEPFVTTKAPGEGMGLGLFLAVSFAELCAGRLELSSRAGGGTTAVLELPRQMRVAR